METGRTFPTEYLPNNVIDKDFQAVLFPLILFPSFFLISRFNIINNFITPEKNVSFYIKGVFGSAFLLVGYTIRLYYYYESIKDFSDQGTVTFLLFFDFCYYSVVGVMIHIASGIQRCNVVEMIIKLQEVIDSIKVDKKEFFLKLKMENWFSFLSLSSVYVVEVLSCSGEPLGILPLCTNFMMTLSISVFDIHILLVTRTVVLIKNVLSSWNHKMLECKDIIKAEEETKYIDHCECMFRAYTDIVKTFRLCNKVYQFALTFFAFQTFLQMLHTLQTVIELGKSSPETSFYQSTLMRVLSALWNLKNFILIASLGVACENFYTTVKIAESYCAQILIDDQATGMRRTCKNVMRLNRASLRRLTAYGVFDLDAAFPLRLLGGLVSYTVVLLQFAFL